MCLTASAHPPPLIYDAIKVAKIPIFEFGQIYFAILTVWQFAIFTKRIWTKVTSVQQPRHFFLRWFEQSDTKWCFCILSNRNTNLDKYILCLGQIYTILTNVFVNLVNYNLQYWEMDFDIWTNRFANLNNYIWQVWLESNSFRGSHIHISFQIHPH